MQTYNIPAENVAEFEHRLDKLAKTARKLNLEGPVFQQTGEHYEDWNSRRLHVIEYLVDFGEDIVLKGWSFVCAIEHTENGNVIKGYSNVDQKWRTAEPNCQHCNQKRHRKTTYVLVRRVESSNEMSEVKQVGSTCLKDFTGHADAEAIADYFTGISEFEGSEIREMEYDPDKSYNANHLDVFKYMQYVAMSVRNHGYISRKNANLGLSVLSTADEALDAMFNKNRKERPSSEDVQTAKAVVDFVSALEPTNDFEHNIKILCTAETAHFHNVGYIAGAFSAYLRDLDEQAKNASSEYVGEVKERRDFSLTLKTERVFEGYYGDTHLYKFADEDGNAIVWFSSKNLHLVVGETYTIKATIKEHKEYNHEKQTVITRGKIL